MQYTKITHPFHEVLSKCHILFMHEWRVNSNKQMVTFVKISPYENFGNWWFTILDHKKPVLAKINLLKVFWSTFHVLINSNYVILETIRNEKKTVKTTKTIINTLFHFSTRSIILESLFLNTCCLGLKTVNKQVIFIFFWLSTKVLVKSRFANQIVSSYLKILKLSNWH